MKAWRQTLAALAALLLFVPTARADEASDEETAEELEEAAKKAMEEAQRMLERAKARRAEEGKPGADTHPAAPGAETGSPGEAKPGLEEVAPEEIPPETKRERRLRLRNERTGQRERIRGERRERKLQIRAERRKRKEEIRAEREKIRAERGRPAFYLNGSLVGAIIAEDEENPITTRDRLSLEGLGFALRAGGILSNHHMFGVRMQTFVHLTRDIIRESGGPNTNNNNMGSIFHFYMGPEYRYITDFNLYFGLSIGGFATGINEDTTSGNLSSGDCYYDNEGYYHCDSQFDEVRSVLGLGVLAEVGYELRFSYWFAMHFELFGGLYHGWDDESFQMNNPTLGLAIGIGI